MIKINDLTVTYQSRESSFTALDKMNITIDSGDTCAIIGPSGCGKSTLLKVLAGVEGSYEGSVTIDEQPVMPSKQRVGFIPQHYGLLEWKTVYQNVILGIRIKDGKSAVSKEAVEAVLEQLGVKELADRYPHQLSGGQRQRVSIARSFLLRPDLLLMDEPFSALDAITREEIQDVFLNIWKENRVTTVLVTHNVEEAVYLGKKIILVSKAPGRAVKTIDNPLFDTENLRDSTAYFQLSQEIRKMIKEDW